MLAGSENRNACRRDIYGGAGLRIAADTGFSLRGRESAESGKRNFFAFLERFGNSSNIGLKRFRGLPLVDAGARGNQCDHLVFGHRFLSLNKVNGSTLLHDLKSYAKN